MNIAFLFNADESSLGSYYGYSILKLILETNVLPLSKRNMKVSLGDILAYSTSIESKIDLNELNKKIYTPVVFNKLLQTKLKNTYNRHNIYCWSFQNITAEIAEQLHNKLIKSNSYLGAMDFSLDDAIQLYFFRKTLIETYRLNATTCSIFYEMGDNQDPDRGELEFFEKNNFSVIFEDSGARNTIFDNYDTIEHYQRIHNFKSTFLDLNIVNDDFLDDIIIFLEELHPKLFDTFSALAKALKYSETNEDLAHCALSGRRILEQVADYLFPPSETLYNGRKVGKAEYKNRLWAYIETTIKENNIQDTNLLSYIGKTVDRLINNFNKGLHSNHSKEDLIQNVISLLECIKEIVNISPSSARRPYLAYEDEI